MPKLRTRSIQSNTLWTNVSAGPLKGRSRHSMYDRIESSCNRSRNLHHPNPPSPSTPVPPTSVRTRASAGSNVQPSALPAYTGNTLPNPAPATAPSRFNGDTAATRSPPAESDSYPSIQYSPAEYGFKSTMTMTPYGMYYLGPRGWELFPIQPMCLPQPYQQHIYPPQPQIRLSHPLPYHQPPLHNYIPPMPNYSMAYNMSYPRPNDPLQHATPTAFRAADPGYGGMEGYSEGYSRPFYHMQSQPTAIQSSPVMPTFSRQPSPPKLEPFPPRPMPPQPLPTRSPVSNSNFQWGDSPNFPVTLTGNSQSAILDQQNKTTETQQIQKAPASQRHLLIPQYPPPVDALDRMVLGIGKNATEDEYGHCVSIYHSVAPPFGIDPSCFNFFHYLLFTTRSQDHTN